MTISIATDRIEPEGDDRTAQISAPPAVPAAVNALADQVADELAAAWGRGDCRPAEAYLAQHPQLSNHPDAALRVIYEEICIRQDMGREPMYAEIAARFPHWERALKVLFECHRLLEPGTAQAAFPEIGTSWNDFHVVAELGRGAEGRVFLATQPALADRPVVLKLTPCRGGEHVSLARLQHAGIVPLYFARDEPARNLRTLCMPYFGGLTLARLLEDLRPLPQPKRTGSALVQALDRAQVGAPIAQPGKGPARNVLAQRTYVDAVCVIGACLAEALQYAHERGLVHMDVKPSNVLLSADGQPMLLDFHLAQPPIEPGKTVPERVGGTLPYMSREQQAAMAAVNHGRALTARVDGRADVYSLGVILYEALGGTIPVLPGVSPPLGKINPQVSPGLSDIVSKCLAYEPGDRYPTAAALAADLVCHLRNQPLRGVANRSWTERWRKWRTRKPHALRYVVGILVVLGAVAAAGSFIRHGLEDQRQQLADRAVRAREALDNGKTWLSNGDYDRARDAFESGLKEVRDLDNAGELWQQLDEQRAVALRFLIARSLHAKVEGFRYRSASVEALSTRAKIQLRDQCAKTWTQRAQVLKLVRAPVPSRIDPDVRAALLAVEKKVPLDLLDTAMIPADLHPALGASGDDARRICRDALKDLDEAEAAERLSALKPQTAWEHFLVGRIFLTDGDLAKADAALDQAIDRDPRAFWPYYYRAKCAYQRKEYGRAIEFFGVCLAREPRERWPIYVNRALAHKALGHADEALRDLRHALDENRNPDRTHYLMALVYRDLRKDSSKARAHLEMALADNPEHADAKKMLSALGP